VEGVDPWVLLMWYQCRFLELFPVRSMFFSVSSFRVSLVVTETVDAGLLGEGILQSLVHAWDHLLLPPGSKGQVANVGRVVPDAAGVWVVPIECIHIARKYQLLNPDMTQQDLSNMTQVIIWSLCFQMLLKLQHVLKTDFSK